MTWVLLVVAGLFETVFALALKASDGFTRVEYSVLVVAAGATSVFVLSLALKDLPVSVGYAAWTGMGAVGAALAGVVLFDESISTGRVLSISLITVGIVLFALNG